MTIRELKIIEFEEGWNFMQKGITKLKRILEGFPEPQFNSEEYTMLYSMIYDMCTQKPPHDYSPQLYEKYKEVFKEYINSTVLPSLREKHDEFLLRELVKRWANQRVCVKWLSRFFHYLDRNFIARRSLPTLNEVGITYFHDLVFKEFKDKVRDSVITLINQERDGELIDRALLKNVLNIFIEIDLEVNMFKYYYENDFEDDMLKDSAAYYAREASNWIIEDSCSDYMLKAEECLKKERERVSHYLHSSSEQKLVEIVQNELLVVYSTQLLENEHSGCWVLLRDDKRKDLSRMYRLFHKIPKGLEPIANIFKQHVTAEGTALVQQVEDEASNKAENALGSQGQFFVRKVIELHDKYMEYVNDCFANNSLFHEALKETFEVLCNKYASGCSSAELLASYCDNILKKGGSEKLSDEAIEGALDKVVKLLAYSIDKDLFAEFYREKLSCRLLSDKSANVDLETIMLSKLKQHRGRQFTSCMEGMVKDLKLASKIQRDFKDHLHKNTHSNLGIGSTLTALTTRFWPTFKSSDLILPAEMMKYMEVFEVLYETALLSKKYKKFCLRDPNKIHLKLTCIHSLGTCNIEGKFEAKTIELKVGTYQAVALLLFNDSDRLSYSEIKTKLNLADDDDLGKVLQSLSCADYKILIKEPNAETVTPIDYFMFNPKFTCKKKMITIPIPPVDERKRKRVVEDIYKDRRYQIEASIVRIMKSRKVLVCQQLVNECVQQLSDKFQPDRNAIKKRIECLIDREFLERDEKYPNLFRYLP